MITLPPALTVDRDEKAEASLLTRARSWLEGQERVEGVHASDLLSPRKGYWRAVDPQPISDREVGLFLVGKILHAFLLSVMTETQEKGTVSLLSTDEGSLWDEDLKLWYSPDRLKKNIPTEIKTSRALYEPKSVEDLRTYLEQLLIYMACRKSLKGRLLVFFLSAKDESNKTSPQFRAYNVQITEEELEALRLEILKLRGDVADAKATKNFRNLPLCPAWQCHPAQCGWWAQCQPEGRYGDPKYLEGKRR